MILFLKQESHDCVKLLKDMLTAGSKENNALETEMDGIKNSSTQKCDQMKLLIRYSRYKDQLIKALFKDVLDPRAIKKNFRDKILIQTHFQRCLNNHSLEKWNKNMVDPGSKEKYGVGRTIGCDICKKKQLEEELYWYRCDKICNFDKCRTCHE